MRARDTVRMQDPPRCSAIESEQTIAESEGSVDHIEAEIDCGQIEELIIQAQDELKVVDMYYENKLWESIHVPEEEFVEAKKVEEGEA